MHLSYPRKGNATFVPSRLSFPFVPLNCILVIPARGMQHESCTYHCIVVHCILVIPARGMQQQGFSVPVLRPLQLHLSYPRKGNATFTRPILSIWATAATNCILVIPARGMQLIPPVAESTSPFAEKLHLSYPRKGNATSLPPWPFTAQPLHLSYPRKGNATHFCQRGSGQNGSNCILVIPARGMQRKPLNLTNPLAIFIAS